MFYLFIMQKRIYLKSLFQLVLMIIIYDKLIPQKKNF